MLSQEFKSAVLKGINNGAAKAARAVKIASAIDQTVNSLMDGFKFVRTQYDLGESFSFNRTDSSEDVYIGLSTYKSSVQNDGILGLEIGGKNSGVYITMLGTDKGTDSTEHKILHSYTATEKDIASILEAVARKAVIDKQILAGKNTPGFKPLL